MRRRPTFGEWLRAHEDEDSPVGDLACDVRRDRRLGRRTQSIRGLRRHMENALACEEALEALDEAARRWLAESRALPPTVVGLYDDGRVFVFCPWCRERHYHSGAGLRVSHCAPPHVAQTYDIAAGRRGAE